MIKTLTPNAEKKLMQVADWLGKGAPHQVLANGQVVTDFHMDHGVALASCGAVCCIAGALVEFNDPFSKRLILDELTPESEMPWRLVRARATHQLGLSDSLEDERFAAELFRAGTAYDNTWITPQIAASVIRDFLLTGELNWEAYMPEGWDPDEHDSTDPMDLLSKLDPRVLQGEIMEEDSRESEDIEDLDD